MLRRNFLSVIPAGLLTVLTGATTLPKQEERKWVKYILNVYKSVNGQEYDSLLLNEIESNFKIKDLPEFRKDLIAFIYKHVDIADLGLPEIDVCKIDPFGNKSWYDSQGELHRENDLPAYISANGSKFWYINGKRHRDNDLPAVEFASGYKAWWVNGTRHRDNDLPAVEFASGTKYWYSKGILHRENGLPCVIGRGRKEWWVNGKRDFSREIEIGNQGIKEFIEMNRLSKEFLYDLLKSAQKVKPC